MSRNQMTDQQRRCFDIIVAAADAGERCPTSVEIAERLSTSPSYIDSVFVALAHKKHITIEGTVKGRIVTVRKTGKTTARINAMPHWSNPATARVDIVPSKLMAPGRYLLDGEGRLQPLRYRKFVKAVAIVTVRAKEPPSNTIELLSPLSPPEAISTVDCAKLFRKLANLAEDINATREHKGKEARKAPEKPVERVEVVEAPKVAPKVIVAPQPRPDPILRPMARKAKPTAVRVPVEELVDEDDDVREFERRLAAKRAERAKRLAPAVKIDAMRLAQALREREVRPKPQPVKKPTRYAQSREACRFCGVPGSRGCEHFLPYEGAN